MEFGHLSDISKVNWDLPPDDPTNLSRLVLSEQSKLYFGAPVWGAKKWLGKIYPLKTQPDEFLSFYAKNFNCIELNASHYRIPDSSTTTKWLSQVRANFHFCPKVHKDISHTRHGMVDKNLLSIFLKFLGEIQGNLGPCFIQLHEMFTYGDKGLLFRFLENWPSEFKLSLELRHPSWFQDATILPALVDYLHRRNIGLVITDVAGRRDVLHTSIATDWVLLRLIGNDLDPSDEVRLKSWAGRLKKWQGEGVKESYVFLHQPDDVMTIEFSQMAQKIFEEAGFSNVPQFKIEKTMEQIDLLSSSLLEDEDRF